VTDALKQSILDKAHRLGFLLAGVTTPDPPPHFPTFENWLAQGRHAGMDYLATDRSRLRRADPRQILPECKSILVLGIPYFPASYFKKEPNGMRGRVASYAAGEDYHLVLPPRLQTLMAFIEAQTGQTFPSRAYTDTGPLLERDLAQRAGLGWIGKNTCLIHPRAGSYFLLAEILLAFELELDTPFTSDHCGNCTRCIETCPTNAILPDRTLDARRCISYLTIENKGNIPENLRPFMQDWIFGCDLCQAACPWNRFANPKGDASFQPQGSLPFPGLIEMLALTPESFNQQFKHSPILRTKRKGLLRNTVVALCNLGDERALSALEHARDDPEPLISEHARWAMDKIKSKTREPK
jgi:epoxyqueuosine reductase